MTEIRLLTRHEEFAEVVTLQQQIWGFKDIELLPLRLFVVAEKVGGQVLGAFDDKRMVAFCLAIPGLKAGGKYYLHSHMLGVMPDYRNSGLGRQLKLKQREEALARGIDLIEWTFDPLEIKNAYFNIERLGAIIRRFVRNQYGTTSSHLHGGLPTDRCTAEWWIQSERVSHILEQPPGDRPPIVASIRVPADISKWKTADLPRARAVQEEVAAQFERHFAARLAVTGFERSPDAGTYQLSQWESD